MGPLEVPEGAYYGASTQRAVQNFPVSGERFDRRFIWALGSIKYAAAVANRDLGLLEPLADRIVLVVRAGVTSKASIQDLMSSIDAQRLLGVVLNEAA